MDYDGLRSFANTFSMASTSAFSSQMKRQIQIGLSKMLGVRSARLLPLIMVVGTMYPRSLPR